MNKLKKWETKESVITNGTLITIMILMFVNGLLWGYILYG